MSAILFVLVFLVTSQVVEISILLAAILPVLLLILLLYVERHYKRSVKGSWVFYMRPSPALMNYLVSAASGHLYTHRIVLGILILVWINDTGHMSRE
jgi:hypothetical protein